MIVVRSSTLSSSSMNVGKRMLFDSFIDEFRRVFSIVLDDLWERERVGKFVSCKQFSHIDTTLSCRSMQCVIGQASALVRGTKKSARILKKQPTKPTSVVVNPELDQRFVKVDWESPTSFDHVMILSSLTKDRKKIIIPLKSTEHFSRLQRKGFKPTTGCRLTKKGVTFILKKDVAEQEGKAIGVDVGILDVWSDSRGSRSTDVADPHGHTLTSVMKRLSRRKKGSKGFKRAQDHRDNFIGWSLNRLDLEGVGEIKREDIRHMRRGRQCDRFRSHWIYTKIFRKLDSMAEEHGVRVTKVDPRDTSRTCPACGAVDAENRRGKRFRCVVCGHTADADLNAAINIERSEHIRNRGVSSPSGKRNRRE